jgi:hypothetical protein
MAQESGVEYMITYSFGNPVGNDEFLRDSTGREYFKQGDIPYFKSAFVKHDGAIRTASDIETVQRQLARRHNCQPGQIAIFTILRLPLADGVPNS